jgi:hypothetical protein
MQADMVFSDVERFKGTRCSLRTNHGLTLTIALGGRLSEAVKRSRQMAASNSQSNPSTTNSLASSRLGRCGGCHHQVVGERYGQRRAFDYTLWFSDTYVRTPNGWRYVFGQSSLPLPKTTW